MRKRHWKFSSENACILRRNLNCWNLLRMWNCHEGKTLEEISWEQERLHCEFRWWQAFSCMYTEFCPWMRCHYWHWRTLQEAMLCSFISTVQEPGQKTVTNNVIWNIQVILSFLFMHNTYKLYTEADTTIGAGENIIPNKTGKWLYELEFISRLRFYGRRPYNMDFERRLLQTELSIQVVQEDFIRMYLPFCTDEQEELLRAWKLQASFECKMLEK